VVGLGEPLRPRLANLSWCKNLSANINPYGAFSFKVIIDGVPAMDFAECVLPTVSVEAVEYRQGADVENNVHKLPGLVKYGNLILKRGIANSADSLALWNWISGFIQGSGATRALSVNLLDSERNPVFQWSFSIAWPVKYESPILNGKTNALAIETLELAVEGIKVSIPGQTT
jgi:phage tail-like protein